MFDKNQIKDLSEEIEKDNQPMTEEKQKEVLTDIQEEIKHIDSKLNVLNNQIAELEGQRKHFCYRRHRLSRITQIATGKIKTNIRDECPIEYLNINDYTSFGNLLMIMGREDKHPDRRKFYELLLDKVRKLFTTKADKMIAEKKGEENNG